MGPSGELLNYWTLVGGIAEELIVAGGPGAIGILLFRRQDDPANRFPEKSGFQ